jgi:hypothetical protein
MSSSSNFGPNIAFDFQDWENFKNHVNSTYPLDSFTHEQKDFVKKCLLHDMGKCSDLNRYWITFLVQNLLEHIDENWSKDVRTLTEQVELLRSICAKAVLGFYENQHSLRLQVPHALRTADQQRMMEIHANIINFPYELLVDIGRYLQIYKMKKMELNQTMSSEQMLLFETIHQRLMEIPQGRLEKQVSEASKSEIDSTVATEGEPEWHSRGHEDNFMR